jgi:RND family efflux transporter MFP subunit
MLALGCLALSGCGSDKAAPPPAKPIAVKVSLPVVKQVTDYEEFVGRTEARKIVEVRARVTGYLDTLCFQDGAFVEKDKVLFEIDPRPFEAERDRADAAIAQSKSRQRTLEYNFQRAGALLPGRAMSREDFDKVAGDLDEAKAMLTAAEAARRTAEINLGFTKVKAPISGLVSRRYKDEGNLVKADETLLTTIVALDPIYAYFDVDERTLLLKDDQKRTLLQALRALPQSGEASKVRVEMGLCDCEDFPYAGEVDFVDNKVDAGTGTLKLRAVFANPHHALTPGLFARVRIQVGSPHKAFLVSDRALGTDQGLKFLFVINAKNEVEYRSVTPGAMHHGLREIKKGLAAGERVLVSGLQRVRPGQVIEPQVVTMPATATVVAREQ